MEENLDATPCPVKAGRFRHSGKWRKAQFFLNNYNKFGHFDGIVLIICGYYPSFLVSVQFTKNNSQSSLGRFPMSKERRLELIKKIEKKRDSYLLAYITSDRPNASAAIAPDIVREMYNLFLELFPLEKKRLDLFLYSRGGDSSVPWQIVSMIRELFEEFNVIIPYKAHSAATMIALGADEIIMGTKGELSPIDVTISGPYNPKDPDTKERLPVSVEDVKGFFSLLKDYGEVPKERATDGSLKLTDHVHPLALGIVYRTLEQTTLVTERLLKSRKEPFDKEINEKIAKTLSAEIFSHMHSISRTEAIKEIGLKQIKEAGDLEPAIWELLTLYEHELKINDPFYPEDIMEKSDDEEMVFPDHKLVYLETMKRTRVFKLDRKMKKIRQRPPNMQFNPQIQIPSIQIPPHLQGDQKTILDFINKWLQGSLPGIINACFDKFKKDFPITAYNRQNLNQKWVNE